MEWKDQYKHPLWQKKRLEALDYYGFECSDCGANNSQLHIHHVRYKMGAKIWEYEATELSVLCDRCHDRAHKSKDEIFDLCLMNRAGYESVIAEIISGFSSFPDAGKHFCNSHFGCVGYGAGYLTNFDAETIIKLTTINPDVLKRFVNGGFDNGSN